MKGMLTALALCSVVFLNAVSSAFASQSVPVTVTEGGKNYLGDLIYPDQPKGPLPVVVVTHEWWGKTKYPEMRGKKIADELGYAALVVDLFGEGKTVDHPKDAQAMVGPFYQNPSQGVSLLKDFIAAAPAAAQKANVSLDLSKLAAIGYCFGGGQVLNLARVGDLPPSEKLLGVVSFHGALGSPLKAKAPIQPKLLVLHGADDKMVDAKQVNAFKKEMKDAKADLEFKAYPGALHAFTNPEATELGKKYKIPLAYNAKADADSWKQMTGFLKKLFGG